MPVVSHRSTDEAGTVLNIMPPEQFDYSCLQDFMACYSEADLASGRFVIDLRNTRYMDSSALGMLLNLYRSVRGVQPDISIINAIASIHRLLVISHFDRKFRIG